MDFIFLQNKQKEDASIFHIFQMVGKMGFEPTTSWSRTKRATKLRYFPLKIE